MVDRVVDKELLSDAKDVMTLLAIEQIGDARNCGHKLFHIEPLLREVWKTVEAKVDETSN